MSFSMERLDLRHRRGSIERLPPWGSANQRLCIGSIIRTSPGGKANDLVESGEVLAAAITCVDREERQKTDHCRAHYSHNLKVWNIPLINQLKKLFKTCEPRNEPALAIPLASKPVTSF